MKRDVIHKTGSTKRIASPAQEGRATGIGNKHKKFVSFGHVVIALCERQTDFRHGDRNRMLSNSVLACGNFTHNQCSRIRIFCFFQISKNMTFYVFLK